MRFETTGAGKGSRPRQTGKQAVEAMNANIFNTCFFCCKKATGYFGIKKRVKACDAHKDR